MITDEEGDDAPADDCDDPTPELTPGEIDHQIAA